MIHIQARDYSIPWADEDFIKEFGSIKGRKCYEIMHGLKSPCNVCKTFEVFKSGDTITSEWRRNGDNYMTIVNPLLKGIPLLIEYMVRYDFPFGFKKRLKKKVVKKGFKKKVVKARS